MGSIEEGMQSSIIGLPQRGGERVRYEEQRLPRGKGPGAALRGQRQKEGRPGVRRCGACGAVAGCSPAWAAYPRVDPDHPGSSQPLRHPPSCHRPGSQVPLSLPDLRACPHLPPPQPTLWRVSNLSRPSRQQARGKGPGPQQQVLAWPDFNPGYPSLPTFP